MRTSTAALACVIALYLSIGISHAGPVQSELKSYRCLVPDWSKTSGGTSPALSPDGKTLVYVVRQPWDFLNDQIWVLSGLDEYDPGDQYARQPTKLPEPWQIKCGELATLEDLNTSVWNSGSDSWSDFRNVDWSPDGKSVAFICHGKLFIAEELDAKAKSAKVRFLADVALVAKESLPADNPTGHRYAEPVLVPRWSPDGTLIAFTRPAPPPGVANQVCVVDVDTGRETVLARDAGIGELVWEQPWSSDSRSLAYSRMRPVNDGSGGVRDGIAIVSITGELLRKAVGGDMGVCPSWSPKGDRLAYPGQSKTDGFGTVFLTIYTCGIDGNEPTPVAEDVPTAAAIAAARVRGCDHLLNVLKCRYPGVFSSAEIKEMTSGSISDGNVIAIMIIAEGKRLANDIGGDFQQKVNAALKRWPVRGKHKFNASSDIAKAVETLPDEKKRAFNEKILITMMEVIRPNLKSTLDMAPTWSPDGKSLAFTRWDATTGYMRLIVVDVLTSKTKTVFESNVIGNVTWTPDSKSLVLSAKRNLAYKGKSDIPGSLWPEVITMPSYPEIWVLDLK